MKKGLIAAGVAVIAVAAVIAVPRIMRKETSVEVVLPVVDLIQPELASIELYRELTGTVEPSDVVYIYPKAAGDVKSVSVKVGDYVTEGQQICEIDTKQVDSAKLTMDAALIALNDANTNLQRMEVLYAAGDISAQAIEQYRSQAQSAQIQYDGAKLAYDYQVEFSKITAPISGKVESCGIEEFDTVSQQSLVCVIAGEGSRAVSFSVPEKIAVKLHVGDGIQIEKNGSDYEGVITEVNTMVDASTGLFKVKASVENGDTLPTGTIVKLKVISDQANDVLTLPVDAVYYSGGDAYIYTYDNGTVHKIAVDVGIYDSERIQILSGVNAGEKVINTWSSELFEGSQVQAADETEQTAATAAETKAE